LGILLYDSQEGGGEPSSDESVFDYDLEECEYLLKPAPDDCRIYIHTQHEIYTQLRRKYPTLSTISCCLITDSIHNLLYHYFGYIGCSTHDPEFIEYIIHLYETNVLQKLSYVEFEKQFDKWVEDSRDPGEEVYVWDPILTMKSADISYMIRQFNNSNRVDELSPLHSTRMYNIKVGGKTRKTRRV
jgi:hypothetical protein